VSKIREAYPNAKLAFVIVPDIAQPGAFNEAVKTPDLDIVLHSMYSELTLENDI
jgi:hypothetical protein